MAALWLHDAPLYANVINFIDIPINEDEFNCYKHFYVYCTLTETVGDV